MYTCFDIAKAFLSFAKKESVGVSPMKLLKLTYIAQGYSLGFFGKPLFNSVIEAWQFGPVIPELYHVIKRYGTHSVDLDTIELYAESKLTEKDEKFLKAIWNFYKPYSGLVLSSKTHQEGSPWANTYKPGVRNLEIDNTVIEKYYKSKIAAKNGKKKEAK